MKHDEVYVDLKGREIQLSGLDADELRLVARLRRRARTRRRWTDFGNFWTQEVAAFYDARGVPRPEARQRAVYRIAQDLHNRLGIAAGLVRRPDYRTELEDLIRREYSTRRAFCEATGLSEDMLSHVLAGRKNLSLATLTEALERVGYGLHLRPLAAAKARRSAKGRAG